MTTASRTKVGATEKRQHQRERRKRKARADRAAAVQQSQQPGVYVSIKQPGRISLNPWPTLPLVRSCLASTYQAWRVLTSGGHHAEFYLERAEQAARSSDQQFKEQIEALMCDDGTCKILKLFLGIVSFTLLMLIVQTWLRLPLSAGAADKDLP